MSADESLDPKLECDAGGDEDDDEDAIEEAAAVADWSRSFDLSGFVVAHAPASLPRASPLRDFDRFLIFLKYES